MKYLKRFESYGYDTINKAKELNAPYVWSAIPDEDIKTDNKENKKPNLSYLKEIEIGSEDAVEKFKKWCGNFWARKENRYKRQDQGQCDTPSK